MVLPRPEPGRPGRRGTAALAAVWLSVLLLARPSAPFALFRPRPAPAATWHAHGAPGPRPPRRCAVGLRAAAAGAPAATNATSPAPLAADGGAGGGRWMDADALVALKESVDLVAFVEAYRLPRFQRTGAARATALCPFHDDTTPSLSVDGSRRLFKCFACGAAGDVFQFVRLYHNKRQQTMGGGTDPASMMTFGQAVRLVADRQRGGDGGSGAVAGAISGAISSGGPHRATTAPLLQHQRQRLLAATAAAADYYRFCLLEPQAGGVRHYLARDRRLGPDTVQAWGLGYAPRPQPQRWGPSQDSAARRATSLVEYLASLDFTPQEIVAAGLATIRRRALESSAVAVVRNASGTDGTNVTEAGPGSSQNYTYADLTERFRGRLMVPIMDAEGTNVLGFGGRILPTSAEPSPAMSAFQGPKYLNSPDSLVFHKSQILFGAYMVNKLLQSDACKAEPFPIIIVEGYMDAIALWQAGVKGVVASMGTALGREQLSLAAETARQLNGRVVLCLDNDAAGLAAVDLVCSNGLLKEACRTHLVQFLIAQLPEGCKDPADFVDLLQAKEGAGSASLQFHRQVLDYAPDWTKYYLNRILSTYNPDALRGLPGSFGYTFERAAEFIAENLDVAERTKMAYEVAGQLANIVATESNNTDASDVVHTQLESDLISLVSRKADAKEALLRLAEATAAKMGETPESVMSSFTRGGTTSAMEEEDKLSRKARKNIPRLAPSDSSTANRLVTTDPVFQEESSVAPPRNKKAFRPRQFKVRRQSPLAPKKSPSLTPHFAGFQFESLFDTAWLSSADAYYLQKSSTGNIQGEFKFSGRIYGPFKPSVDEDKAMDGPFRLERPVYFNSNYYHGQKFLSDQAATAGYRSNLRAPRDMVNEFIRKGVGLAPLARHDIPILRENVENQLLAILIKYASGRSVIKNIHSAREAVGIDYEISWSCSDKKWLFQRLIDGTNETIASLQELRAFLITCHDCPTTAFGSNYEGPVHVTKSEKYLPQEIPQSKSIGTPSEWLKEAGCEIVVDDMNENREAPIEAPTETALSMAMDCAEVEMIEQIHREVSDHALEMDLYDDSFRLDYEPDPFDSSDDRGSLSSRIGTLDHFFNMNDIKDHVTLFSPGVDSVKSERQIQLAVQTLFYALQWAALSQRVQEIQDEAAGDCPGKNGTLASTKGLSTAELKDVSEKLVSLYESLDQLSTKLVYSDNTDSTMSLSVQAEIFTVLGDHVSGLSIQEGIADQEKREPAGTDFDGEESVTETLDRIELEFGDFCKEDYVWSSETVQADQRVQPAQEEMDLEGEESLEETLERIDQDWASWL